MQGSQWKALGELRVRASGGTSSVPRDVGLSRLLRACVRACQVNAIRIRTGTMSDSPALVDRDALADMPSQTTRLRVEAKVCVRFGQSHN